MGGTDARGWRRSSCAARDCGLDAPSQAALKVSTIRTKCLSFDGFCVFSFFLDIIRAAGGPQEFSCAGPPFAFIEEQRRKNVLKEFKEFAMRGSVVDLAVGLFINLSDKPYETLAAAKAAGAPTLNYGIFLNSLINFLIVAFCVFLVVQQVNRWTKKPAAPGAPTTKECPQCAMTIPIGAKRCGHCTAQLV